MSGYFVEQNLNKAKSLVRNGKMSDAITLYNAIIKKFPNNERAKLAIKKLQPSPERINTLLNYYEECKYEKAETVSRLFTKDFPGHSFGWQVLGAVLKNTGRVNDSIIPFKKAILISPQDAVAHSNLGITLTEVGEFEEAEKVLSKAILLNPRYPLAHNNLGVTLRELGKLEEAEKCFRQVIFLENNFAEGYSNLAKILKELKRFDEAELNLRKAIALKPNDFENYNNLGVILKELGKLKDSESILRQAIAINPKYLEAHNNLGNTLRDIGRLEEAVECYELIIKHKFDSAEAHNNLGTIYRELGKFQKSEESLRQSIKIRKNFVEAYNNLANTLKEAQKFDEAQECYNYAIKLNPNNATSYSNLGGLLHARGLQKESIDNISHSIALDPDNVSYRWDYAINQLSKVYISHEAYLDSLKRFQDQLLYFDKFMTSERLNEAAKFVGKSYPYYLAYFENDNKYLLEKHGNICYRIMKQWQEKECYSFDNAISTDEDSNKIKIGVVSAHIHYHSVWNSLLKGIVENLNKDKFEIYIFSLGKVFDKETTKAKDIIKHFYTEEGGVTQWANKIISSKIDIAFYPEIGMDQPTVQLASMRLAPVQVCSWGHPETSGLPTMDYYISSEFLETSSSKKYYTEKLIKLPGMGYYFNPPTLETSEINLADMGINTNLPLLLCLGAPNKFSPFYDWVLVEIIKRIKNCQLVFMNDFHGASEILKNRLKKQLDDSGLDFKKHIIFIPQLSRKGYSTIMKNSDVLLDTLGFSGLNTAMQAIGCGLPIITRVGKFQRTRHASAILKTLKLEELIANTEKEYIDLVVKVSLDKNYQNIIRRNIKERENILYRNQSAIQALEEFFENVGNEK